MDSLVASLAPSFFKAAVRNFVSAQDKDRELGRIYCLMLTDQDRQEMDDWLCRISHPLAFEPGTNEQRFRAIVRELAAAKES